MRVEGSVRRQCRSDRVVGEGRRVWDAGGTVCVSMCREWGGA